MTPTHLHINVHTHTHTLKLEDGHSLFDYDVGLNDIIQLIIRPALPADHTPSEKNGRGEVDDKDKENRETSEDVEMVYAQCLLVIHFSILLTVHCIVG